MDYQVLFNVAFSLVGFLGGWVLNTLAKSIQRLDDDIRAMPHNYVSRDDWRDAMKDMKEEMRIGFDKLDASLSNVFKKLDRKEDKA